MEEPQPPSPPPLPPSEGESEDKTVNSDYYDMEIPISKESGSFFSLENAVCSHGLFMTSPNHWDPHSHSLLRPLHLSLRGGASAMVRVSGSPHSLWVRVYGTSNLCPAEREAVEAQVRRMVRLDEREETKVREFHGMHEEAKKKGFGRVFRSPTLFEDMVKCILFCNCQWPRTLCMAKALCELQLELQHHSPQGSDSTLRDTNSKNSVTETDNFAPKTPAGKESNRKHKLQKTRKALFKRDDEIDSNERENAIEPMNLCSDLSLVACFDHGVGNFPSPEEIASLDEKYLAKRCGLGYRAGRILKLARNIVEGRIQLSLLEELSVEASLLNCDKVDEKLREIEGFGPFTRGNVLMCMGFYNVVPSDSETIRHLKKVHARSTTVQTVQKAVEEIYGGFQPFQFLAYWYELWSFYEGWFGKISEMPTSNYKLITATNMKNKRKYGRSICPR